MQQSARCSWPASSFPPPRAVLLMPLARPARQSGGLAYRYWSCVSGLRACGCLVWDRRGCEPGRCSPLVVGLAAISHAPWHGLAPGASSLASRWHALYMAMWFRGPLPPHPVRLEWLGCDCARTRAVHYREWAWTRREGHLPRVSWCMLQPPRRHPIPPPP